MTIDISKIIEKAIKSPIESKVSKKIVLVYLALQFFILIACSLGIFLTIMNLSMSDTLLNAPINNEQEFTLWLLQNLQKLSVEKIVQSTSILLALTFGIITITALASVYINGWAISKILEELEGTKKEFNFQVWLKLVLQSIWKTIMIITSWQNKILFGLFIILLLLGIVATFVLPILLLIVVPLGVIYFIVIIYNSLRLTIADCYLIDNNKGPIVSVRETWRMTKGNVLTILIVLAVLTITGILASVGVHLILIIPKSLLSLLISSGLKEIIFITTDLIVSIIIQAIFYFISVNAIIRIYLELKNAKTFIS